MWGMVAGGVMGFLRQTVRDRASERRRERQLMARMKECPLMRGLDTTEEHLLGLFEMITKEEDHAMLTRATDRIELLAATYVKAMREDRVDMCEATMARTAGITALEEVGAVVSELVSETKEVTRLVQARTHVENNVHQLLKCLQTLALAKKTRSSVGGSGAKMAPDGATAKRGAGTLRQAAERGSWRRPKKRKKRRRQGTHRATGRGRGGAAGSV